MRVAVFTDNDFAKVNGVTTTLQALLRWAPADVEPRIYTAEDRGRDEPDYLSLRSAGIGIPFYREMRMYLPRVGSYLRHARQDRIDVVHLTTPGPVGLAALSVARRLQVPLVGSFHTDLGLYATLLSGSSRLGMLMNQYLRWPYGRCTRVLVPSSATAAILARSRIAPGKHVIWRRGVDATTFSPGRRSALRRARWGVRPDVPVVIYAGRVSREKGLGDLGAVRACLERARLPHRLVVVGDGPFRRDLQQALPDAVFEGSVPHHDVGECLASADVFAFPSCTDTAGNVVLEAQACGLPAIVRSEGGPAENVVAASTGFVCDGVEAFASSVEQLVGDRPLRTAMASAARRYALTRDWPAALAPLFATYREVVSSPAAPHDTAGRPRLRRAAL